MLTWNAPVRSTTEHARNQAKNAALREDNESPASVAAGPKGGARPRGPAAAIQSEQLHAGTRLRGRPASARRSGRYRHGAGGMAGLLQGARCAAALHPGAQETAHQGERV